MPPLGGRGYVHNQFQPFAPQIPNNDYDDELEDNSQPVASEHMKNDPPKEDDALQRAIAASMGHEIELDKTMGVTGTQIN